MEENKKAAEAAVEDKKPTYEQLKNWLDQVVMQRNKVAERLNEVTDVLNKLPWLFKVLENSTAFPQEFVEACSREIVFIMTPPVEEDNKEQKEEPKE